LVKKCVDLCIKCAVYETLQETRPFPVPESPPPLTSLGLTQENPIYGNLLPLHAH